MSRIIKVGYMGIPYSNTWMKTMEFVQEKGWDAQLVALMNARATVDALVEGDIDYAVLAYTNNLAGDVKETTDALKGVVLEVVAKGGLPIHHCVFAKSADVQVKEVSSHIHALKQCAKSLRKLYPDAVQMESADTAYSAQMLAEGTLPDTTAVLCTRPAWEHWNLVLLHENIEDRSDNTTQFVMLRMPRPSPDIPDM